MIDKSVVEQVLTYNQDTGVFIFKPRDIVMFKTKRACTQWNNRYANKVAGSKKSDSGYQIISIFKKQYRAHCLAILLTKGHWHMDEVDHINGDRDDNRIDNLREVTKGENTRNKCLLSNNKTGFHGVSLHPNGKYRAKGWIGNKQKHLGYFETVEQAAAVRRQFEAIHGFHKNHGRSPEERVA